MHSATTATGHLQTYPKHVYAEPLTLQKMTSHAQTKGVTIISHNEVCDLTAILLAKVWWGMSQILLTTTLRWDTVYSVTTEHNVRLDAAASGSWGGRFERWLCLTFGSLVPTFYQTETFQSHLCITVAVRHKFEEWIVVEQASSPLCTCSHIRSCSTVCAVFKRLTALQVKWQ